MVITNDTKKLDEVKEFSDKFINYYDTKKDFMSRAEKNIVKLLECKLDNFQKINIESRLKSEGSLREKIIRKNYTSIFENPEELFAKIPDLLGIRIISFLNHEEKIVDLKLRELFRDVSASTGYTNQLKAEHDKNKNAVIKINFKDEPDIQKNGNPIYKYELRYELEDEPEEFFNFEIQNKSLVHNFWGEIEHKLIYKNYDVVVDQNFISGLMLTINKSLSAIDSQLEMIQNHLKPADESSRQVELKRMSSRIIAPVIDKKFEKIYHHPLDLRPVHDLIVDLHYQTRSTESVLINHSVEFINKLQNFSVSREQIDEENCLKNDEDKSNFIEALSKDASYHKKALLVIFKVLMNLENKQYTELSRELRKNIKIKIETVTQDIFDLDELEESHKNKFKEFFVETIISKYIESKNFIYLNPPLDNLKLYINLIKSCLEIPDLDELNDNGNLKSFAEIILSSIFEGVEPENDTVKQIDSSVHPNWLSEENLKSFFDNKSSFSQIIDKVIKESKW